MEHITNTKITKVYEGPKGEGKYGPWKIYNLYLEGQDNKFSYAQSGKKPIPVQGMKIKHIEYEEKERNGYTNLEIKKMEIDEENSPQPQPQNNSNRDKEMTFYVSYAKDIQIALIQIYPKQYIEKSLDDLTSDIMRSGKKMLDILDGNPLQDNKHEATQKPSQTNKKGSPVNEQKKDKESSIPIWKQQIWGFISELGSDLFDEVLGSMGLTRKDIESDGFERDIGKTLYNALDAKNKEVQALET